MRYRIKLLDREVEFRGVEPVTVDGTTVTSRSLQGIKDGSFVSPGDDPQCGVLARRQRVLLGRMSRDELIYRGVLRP